MEQMVRASVRQLVEFSIHGEDLAPGGSLRDMQLGALGHKARQGLLPEGWEAEKALSGVFEKHGVALKLSGRMDVYRFKHLLFGVLTVINLCVSIKNLPRTTF